MAARNTIDQLLADLADDGFLINPEKVRHRVRSFVRNVFRDIGFEKMCSTYTQSFEILGHTLSFADHVMYVEDIASEGGIPNGKEIETGMFSSDALAFWREPFGLHFPNMQTGTVDLIFYGLAVDGEGQALIPEQAYEACLLTCQAQLIKTLPLHPRRSEQPNMAYEAEREVAKTRAELSRTSHAKQRTMRRGGRRVTGWFD